MYKTKAVYLSGVIAFYTVRFFASIRLYLPIALVVGFVLKNSIYTKQNFILALHGNMFFL